MRIAQAPIFQQFYVTSYFFGVYSLKPCPPLGLISSYFLSAPGGAGSEIPGLFAQWQTSGPRTSGGSVVYCAVIDVGGKKVLQENSRHAAANSKQHVI